MVSLPGIATCGPNCLEKGGRKDWPGKGPERGARLLLATSILVVSILLGLALDGPSGSVAASGLSGPVEIHISGLDRGEGKVYYWLISRAGPRPVWQIWFFDLDGEEPTTPIRAVSIEEEMGECRITTPSHEDRVHSVWGKTSGRLRSLRPLEEYTFSIGMVSDSVAVDTALVGNTLYESRLVLDVAGGPAQTMALEMLCDPLIAVQGVYAIPGRPELIVVVTYKGRAYGCKDVDLPVLIPVE